MNRVEAKQQIAQFRASSLKDHQLAPANTKSWLVSQGGRLGAHYWYTVTWSYPGVLTVSGDIGEITVTHYGAMDTWVGAANWIAGSGHDYLLEKSNHKQVYDPEQTLETLAQWANDEITDHADEDEELRCIFYSVDGGSRCANQQKANEHWYSGTSTYRVEAPEGWHLWFKILSAVGEHHKPNDIFSETEREELTNLLREALDQGQDTASDLIYRLDLSDYYGSYAWSSNSLNLMAALYHWAELVQASAEFTSESAKLQGRAELARQSRADDQRMPSAHYGEHYAYHPGVFECRIGSQLPVS